MSLQICKLRFLKSGHEPRVFYRMRFCPCIVIKVATLEHAQYRFFPLSTLCSEQTFSENSCTLGQQFPVRRLEHHRMSPSCLAIVRLPVLVQGQERCARLLKDHKESWRGRYIFCLDMSMLKDTAVDRVQSTWLP